MNSRMLTKLSSLILFALFVCVLLVALVAGVRSYSTQVEEKNLSDDLRYANGLLVNSVKGYDVYDSVRFDVGPEGQALVLTESIPAGNFETRIYRYAGNIVEEYTVAGSPYAPATATPIMASKTFDFKYEQGLLTIVTDRGRTEIALRACPLIEGGALR